MTNMFMEDYAFIRQEDGYLSGRCELSDDELQTFKDVYKGISPKVWKFDIHIPLPDTDDIDSINTYIKNVIEIIGNMNQDDFKRIIFNALKELHEENGMQQADWANEYRFKSSDYDTIMQNNAKKWEVDIEDLMDLNQYLDVVNDDLDEDEQYASMREIDELDDNDEEYNILYDARGNTICERIVEYLEKQI